MKSSLCRYEMYDTDCWTHGVCFGDTCLNTADTVLSSKEGKEQNEMRISNWLLVHK